MAVNAAMGTSVPGGVARSRALKDLPSSQCVSSTRPSINGAWAALPASNYTAHMR